jgi:RNA polymerase sigma factor (sigma-70 family)
VTVDDQGSLAQGFEAHRDHLRAVAYRMLGAAGEADDAVQQTWLRLTDSDADTIENLGGWLTTVVSRICLDMLRSRRSRREEPLGPGGLQELMSSGAGTEPEHEALLVDSVGRALLVVLDTLGPAERLAFVLHDMFAVPFDEIAPIVERSPSAAKKLASRARLRVRGTPTVPAPDLARQREVTAAFYTAVRGGDFDALVAVLAPDVVRRADAVANRVGAPTEVRGASEVAKGALAGGGGQFSDLALVGGEVGLIMAPRGRLLLALRFTISDGKIAEIDAIAEPARLRQLEVAVLVPPVAPERALPR